MRGNNSSQGLGLIRTQRYYNSTLKRRDRGIYTELTLLLAAQVDHVLGNMDRLTTIFPGRMKAEDR